VEYGEVVTPHPSVPAAAGTPPLVKGRILALPLGKGETERGWRGERDGPALSLARRGGNLPHPSFRRRANLCLL